MSEPNSASIVAELHYSDPDAALNWLSEVFGFKKLMIVRDQSGKIVFSQLEMDGAIIAIIPEQLDTMRSPKAVNGVSTQTTQVRFKRNVDEHYAHTLANRGDYIVGAHNAFLRRSHLPRIGH